MRTVPIVTGWRFGSSNSRRPHNLDRIADRVTVTSWLTKRPGDDDNLADRKTTTTALVQTCACPNPQMVWETPVQWARVLLKGEQAL
jgi:hypothetical protein